MIRTAEQIFHEARGMPLAEQAAYLKRACGDDETLRTRVEALLKADAEAGQFLETVDPTEGLLTNPSSPEAAATMAAPLREGPGTRIGPYKILQLIGEGGFGSVFMAEQTAPVQRKVALKIIKLGMDTRAVIARFEAERQALAMMEHPNIARVLDAGATESGRPYFVMELVKGEAITEYCDRHNLGIRERLGLFLQVCHAVQHAHQKGIIHRDLKPGNVLVTVQGEGATAKVIDFGIAKATAARLTERTLFTEHGALIGTPEYMSPEQAEGSTDIDTRTDVYSLGVLLYELLTGSTPFQPSRLRWAAYAEIRRIIREVEPDKPSTRLSRGTDELPTVAAHRRIEPARLTSTIRGELDWIVMKALEKDRSRRYEAVSDLASDIGRHLGGQPVLAAPPSAAYRVRKFVGRHRPAVLGAALVLTALLIGLVGTAAGFRNAMRANRDLGVALDRVRQEQEGAARSQARLSLVHGFFLDRLLGANDPDVSGGEDLRVRKVLDDAAAELEHVSDQDVEGALRHEIGAVYLSLGLWKEAEAQLVRALKIRDSAPQTSKAELADTLVLAARSAQGLDNAAGAESLARRARGLRAELFGEDADATAEADLYLAGAIYRAGRVNDAAAVNEASLAAQATRHGPGSETTLMARAMVMYASEFLSAQGRHEDAAQRLREAVVILRRHPGADSQLAWALSALGKATAELKLFDESDRSLEESIAIRRRLYPQGHNAIAQSLVSLGISRMRRGRAADGEGPVRDAIRMYSAALGPDHEFVAKCTVVLGAILASQDKWDQAVEAYTKAATIYAAKFPGDDARTANAKSQWGGCLIELKRFGDAEPLLLEAYGMLERTKGNPAAQRVTAERLVQLYKAWGKDAQAQEWTSKSEALKPPSK
jgi:serine/threonine protein kinase/tetratricopeptide (TPR) repeat protein